MKLTLVFLAIAALVAVEVSGKVFIKRNAPPPIVARNPRARSATLHSITMPVDHFNTTDSRTWSMRYYANPQHFVKSGPIFIFLGGEWTIDPDTLQGGQIYDIAEEQGGYLLYTEHRYFGESMPVRDFSTPNMKYLTVRQALADVAAFVKEVKQNPDLFDSKVVVVGGSYSGTMATFMRAEYPDVIDAAYASSAPLLLLHDFKQYMEVAGAVIRLEHPTCWDVIREGTKAMEELYETEDGVTQLTNLIGSCKRINPNFPHRDHFFNQIGDLFAVVVQYAQPGEVYAKCEKMVNLEGTSLDKFAAYVRELYGGCLGNYDDLLYWYSLPERSSNAFRTWLYLTCNEIGLFQSGNSTAQPFGVNWFTSLSHSFCRGAFGEEFTPERILNSIDETEAYWGGLHPNVTKVVFTHGTGDPWHSIGIVEDLNEDAPAILIKGTSHCADLSSISPDDTEELRHAKQTAKDRIAKWIS